MRRFLLILAIPVTIYAQAVFGQSKSVTFNRADVEIREVRLSPGTDGGVRLEVAAYVEAANNAGVALERANVCETTTLTSAQRTCLATIRNAAVACWATQEGL